MNIHIDIFRTSLQRKITRHFVYVHVNFGLISVACGLYGEWKCVQVDSSKVGCLEEQKKTFFNNEWSCYIMHCWYFYEVKLKIFADHECLNMFWPKGFKFKDEIVMLHNICEPYIFVHIVNAIQILKKTLL